MSQQLISLKFDEESDCMDVLFVAILNKVLILEMLYSISESLYLKLLFNLFLSR